VSWSRKFDDPILAPGGTRILTLRRHLAKTVPKAEQNAPKVLNAAKELTAAAERSDDAWMFFARAATLQAIHRNERRSSIPIAKTITGGSGG